MLCSRIRSDRHTTEKHSWACSYCKPPTAASAVQYALTLIHVILVQHEAESVLAGEVLGQHNVLVDEVDRVVQVVVLQVLHQTAKAATSAPKSMQLEVSNRRAMLAAGAVSDEATAAIPHTHVRSITVSCSFQEHRCNDVKVPRAHLEHTAVEGLVLVAEQVDDGPEQHLSVAVNPHSRAVLGQRDRQGVDVADVHGDCRQQHHSTTQHSTHPSQWPAINGSCYQQDG